MRNRRSPWLAVLLVFLAGCATDLSNISLSLAITANETNWVKSALRRGDPIEAQDSNGYTPLTLAAFQGHVEIMKILLDRGANLHAKDGMGDTALIKAIGKPAAVKILLEKGADPNARDRQGSTPLMLAVRSYAAVGALRFKDPKQQAIMQGMLRGYPEVVKLLIEKGADMNAEDSNHVTALFLAVQSGQADIVRIFSDHGADLSKDPFFKMSGPGIIKAKVDSITKEHPEMAPFFQKMLPEIEAKSKVEEEAQKVAQEAQWDAVKPKMEIAERAGDNAARKGQNDEALANYTAAFFLTASNEVEKRRLQEKMLKFAGSLNVPVELPEHIREMSVKGQTMFKQAQEPVSYGVAISVLAGAVNFAPWNARGYYNVAIAQEGYARWAELQYEQDRTLVSNLTVAADLYGAAIENLKFYQLGAPNAQDAQEAEKKIFDLEVRKAKCEKAAKQR